MDTRTYVEELLDALTEVKEVERITFQAEGPVVGGRAYLQGDVFLSFYHNGETGTVAFALIKGQSRIWGIDHDSIRGWHLHPVEAPERHVVISPLSVSDVIQQLRQVLTGSRFI